MATSEQGSGKVFTDLLKRLVRVPKEELVAEERKHQAANRRRKQRAAKKES